MALATYGIIVLGIFIGIIGERLVEMHKVREDEKQKAFRETALHDVMPEGLAEAIDPTGGLDGRSSSNVSDENGGDDETSLLQNILGILALEAPIVSVALVVAVAIGYAEGWTFDER